MSCGCFTCNFAIVGSRNANCYAIIDNKEYVSCILYAIVDDKDSVLCIH